MIGHRIVSSERLKTEFLRKRTADAAAQAGCSNSRPVELVLKAGRDRDALSKGAGRSATNRTLREWALNSFEAANWGFCKLSR
jgi:hypothetical protein